MRLSWEYGSVQLSEYDSDGFLGIQIDAYGEQQSGMQSFEAVHPHGFQSRPRDPDIEGQDSALYYYQGDQAFVLPLHDARAINDGQVPELTKGSSVQYAHRAKGKGFSYDRHDGETGTKEIRVKYDGGEHVITIPGDGDTISIDTPGKLTANVTGDVSVTTSGSLKASAPAGAEINGAKIDATGDVKTATGVSLALHTHPTPLGPTGPPTPSG